MKTTKVFMYVVNDDHLAIPMSALFRALFIMDPARRRAPDGVLFNQTTTVYL